MIEPAVEIIGRVLPKHIAHLARGGIHDLKRTGSATLAFAHDHDLARMVPAIDNIDLLEIHRALLPGVPDQLVQGKDAILISKAESELAFVVSQVAEIAARVHFQDRVAAHDVLYGVLRVNGRHFYRPSEESPFSGWLLRHIDR